jgi:hypothetical protein
VTDSIGDQGASGGSGDGASGGSAGESGPDPVIGAGVTLLGIFLMGTGGARDAHYVFDVGVLTALLGAGTFVLFVALAAMRQKQAPKGS